MRRWGHFAGILTAALANSGGVVWGASISVYIAAPQVVTSPATGGTAVNETFNNISRGVKTTNLPRAVGVFNLSATNALSIEASGQYGGANRSRYAAFGAQSGTSGAITLNLANPAAFVGLWWSAMDGQNAISLYNGNTLLTRFSATDLTSVLSAASTISSVGGTVYNTADYRGKPATGPPRQNSGEYYAYTMFYASGLTFNRIVFDNSGTAASGFEFDNLQTRSGTITIPGANVLITNLQVVPEPDFWFATAGALCGAALWRRRRKARRHVTGTGGVE